MLLAAATPLAPVAPTPAVTQEIVVMGKKLKDWKGGVSKVGGRMVCKTKKSSGDKALDAIRCGAMLSCVKPLEPRIDALMGSALPIGQKRRDFDKMLTGIEPCLETYTAGAVARLAEDRVEDRGEAGA
jgi:hypothetical protein